MALFRLDALSSQVPIVGVNGTINESHWWWRGAYCAPHKGVCLRDM